MKFSQMTKYRNNPLPMFVILMALFSVLRLCFHMMNFDQFDLQNGSSSGYLSSYWFGIRLDAIVVFYLTIVPFFLLSFVTNKPVRIAIISIVVSIPILVAAIDAEYFKFAKERLGIDVSHFLESDNNISLLTYLYEYWLLAIVVLLSIGFMAFLLYRISPLRSNKKHTLWNIAIFAMLFFMIRGGFRSRPLRSVDAAQSVEQQLIPLSLNPSLLITESLLNQNSELHLADFPEISPIPKNFASTNSFKKMNVVIVIVESFGKEYTALNHNYALNYTPFLNSLMKESLVFTDAYANGLKSMDAVPAIFCGIPRIQSVAAINSPNALKPTTSLMRILSPFGYRSLFFHGADNNTMGFRSYLRAQGLDDYFGIEEYPNLERDNDGKWGIYDAPYLQYTADVLNQQKEPFVAGIFTLSSHHPYLVPPNYKNRFPKGNLKIHESIGYADFALDSFFQTCSKMPWFKNTLFVITADHSSENALHAYRTPSGKYEIPLLFYAPGFINPSENQKTVSQIDILPTVLDFLNVPVSMPLLGKSGLDQSQSGWVCHFDNGHYHITSDGWNMGVNNKNPVFLYNKIIDPNCLNNLVNQYPDTISSLYNKLKQFSSEFKAINH